MTEHIDARAMSPGDYAAAKAALVSAARRGNTPMRQQAPVVPAVTPAIATKRVTDMSAAEYAAARKSAIKRG